MRNILLTSAVLLITVGCGTQKTDNMEETPSFAWQIDRFDDVKVLRYQVPDFDSLELQQKKLIYFLSEAALSGRDIFFDQNFKYNLPIRKTLEAIYTNYSGSRDTEDFKNFEKYLKKVWFANGIHHHYSNDKFFPEFSIEYFNSLVAATESLSGQEAIIAEITPAMFDKTLYLSRNNQTSGVDMVASSSNNYYSGLTQKEVEDFYASVIDPTDSKPISYGLNSTLVKKDGKIYEEVWRVGGKYSAAIERIVFWLEKASEVAENGAQKEYIDALVSYYKSGDLKEFDRYNIMWVKDTLSTVDFVNGFIENYGDPMGYKASWESSVNFKNIEATKRTELISSNAQWFEDNSPIDGKFKKPEVKGVSAKVITVAQLGGDCFPATPIGINLPNADWIRKEHGSKSVTIQNITYAYSQAAAGNGFLEEFTLSPEDIAIAKEYGALASDLHTDMHECLGHGSGQLAPGVKGDELKNYGSPLEEARADLFALYYIGDPKMVELGIMPSMDVMKAAYTNTMFNGLMGQLTRIEPGKDIVQAHMRDRQLIAAWVLERGAKDNVVEIIKNGGKSYVQINDYQKLRALFGELLKEVQRIKSEGDFAAGKELIERYAVKVNPAIHAEVLERFATLDIAPYSGFVNPKISPVFKGGEIVDVQISYPDNFSEQMLEYAKEYSFL